MTVEQVCCTPKSGSENSQKSSEDMDYEKVRTVFDSLCLEIAKRYNLYYSNGKPRRAGIIEVIARTACSACIDRKLKKNESNHVDALYKEFHQQACNILVEELYNRFNKLGLIVAISTEKQIQYCKADVFIFFNGHNVDLLKDQKEVAVEIKTGLSMSMTQLLRYLLDKPDRDLILWRIRNKQVLIFGGAKLRPLLTQFMKMFIQRANRLLASTEASCDHNFWDGNWSPTQQQLQEAFSDFAEAVVRSLPNVVDTIISILNGEKNNQC